MSGKVHISFTMRGDVCVGGHMCAPQGCWTLCALTLDGDVAFGHPLTIALLTTRPDPRTSDLVSGHAVALLPELAPTFKGVERGAVEAALAMHHVWETRRVDDMVAVVGCDARKTESVDRVRRALRANGYNAGVTVHQLLE
jgi:hypothetical protein